MENSTKSVRGKMPWRIFLSLTIATLAARPHIALVSILLVDIAHTFGVPVGVMSQIRSTSSIVSMVFALIMGILSIKYRPKPLLMIGLSLFIVASFGCSFAPTYNIMLLFYTLTGVGVAMVTPSSQTLVGEHIDVDNRPRALSYMLMTFTLFSALVTSPVINQLSIWGGWRMSFLYYVLPGAILGLFITNFGIPSTTSDVKETARNRSIIEAFGEMLSNRSALVCILCAALGASSFTAVSLYGISSFVERFSMSPAWRAPLWSVLTFTGAIGSYLSGRLVAWFGRRPVCIVSILLMGVLTIGFMNMNAFWPSVILITLSGVSWTVWNPAATSLTLQQNPRLRGSVMSLNEASRNLGVALGVGLGGFMLLQYGYGSMGLILGSLALTASALYYLFSVDPTIE